MSSTETLLVPEAIASAPVGNTYRFAQFSDPALIESTPAALLAAARAEALQIRERARVEGYAVGHQQGIRDGLAATAPLTGTLQAAAAGTAERCDQLLAELTEQAAELAVVIAEQVLSATLEVRPEQLLEVVRVALRRLTERTRVTVAVNPDDLQLLRDSADQIRLELGGIEHLDLQAARRVGRGGALVSTAMGEIDCTIEAQLRSVREIVAAALTTPAQPAAESSDSDVLEEPAAAVPDTEAPADVDENDPDESPADER